MRFEELSKEHQEFLMYCLSVYIKSKVKREEKGQVIEPTYEEYKAFFDEFDEEYVASSGEQPSPSQRYKQAQGSNPPPRKGTGYRPIAINLRIPNSVLWYNF